MKTNKVLILTLLLLVSLFSSQVVNAQQKSKEETQKEEQLKKTIEDQKKAMADQKKAQAESEYLMQEKQSQLNDLMEDLNVTVESSGRSGDAIRVYSPRGNRSLRFDDPIYVTPDLEGFFGHYGGDSERTTWDFSKSVKESTFSRDYSFDVEKTVKSVIMSIMGDCKAGDIHIKIVMPNGKDYSDIVIDEFGNLNWRKSFTISETENQDKTGEWKFQISSSNATGYFKISLQTY